METSHNSYTIVRSSLKWMFCHLGSEEWFAQNQIYLTSIIVCRSIVYPLHNLVQISYNLFWSV